jgi:hypothetical protein
MSLVKILVSVRIEMNRCSCPHLLELYSNGNQGSASFPLGVQDVTGYYHYRIMVNYVGTNVHCVYESVPFMIVQSPFQKYKAAGPPRPDTDKGVIYTELPARLYVPRQ